jgi:NAD(P)-dependent dehydrogenase (short-subunit alcohol dehydrogenase family)
MTDEIRTNKDMDKQQDPKEVGPKPPFSKQEKQEFPGSEARMTPQADHGEESYRGSGKLTGKVAIVTGADSGIGRAVALAFAREGADVLISYLNEEEDARETERLVTESGRRAIRMAGDLSDINHCNNLVQRALSDWGRLDILVNNAAYSQTHLNMDEITPEEFEHTFRVNVFAIFNLCRAAMAFMKPGSSIINTTSVQSYRPSGTLLAYASTKGAVTAFTKGLAELAIQQGIRVNAVAPGPVWTPLVTASNTPESVAEFGKDTPMGRPAMPKELAPVFVLLASDEASYITGAIYEVTGGTPTA